MSIPVTVNGYTFNFLADPTSPYGWDIQPASTLPMGVDQLTLWNNGEAAAQIAYDEALVTYWYTIESIADEYDPTDYATAYATYSAAVGGDTSAYDPSNAAWQTFADAIVSIVDNAGSDAVAAALAALAILDAAYDSYNSAYSSYETGSQAYTDFLAARAQAIAQQIAQPYIVNGQPSGNP